MIGIASVANTQNPAPDSTRVSYSTSGPGASSGPKMNSLLSSDPGHVSGAPHTSGPDTSSSASRPGTPLGPESWTYDPLQTTRLSNLLPSGRGASPRPNINPLLNSDPGHVSVAPRASGPDTSSSAGRPGTPNAGVRRLRAVRTFAK